MSQGRATQGVFRRSPFALLGLMLATNVACTTPPTSDAPSDASGRAPEASDLVVTFLGTGSPRPSALRFGSSILLEAGAQRVLGDASWGLRERLLEEHMPIDLETRQLVDFDGQTYGYRIDYGEHSAVFSGDTRPSSNLIDHAVGADLLIHEVQVPSPGATEEARLANVSLSVHSTPEEVGGVFSAVRPRLAVYSHIIPPEVSARELAELTPYDGRMVVAHDLMMIVIGDEIRVGDRPSIAVRSFEESEVLR